MNHIWCCRRNGGKPQKTAELLKMEEEKTVVFLSTLPCAMWVSSNLNVSGFNATALVGDHVLDAEIIR